MLPLLAILVLLVIPLVMLGIRLARPRFAYFWLIAALGALLAWPVMLLARLNLPLTIPLSVWQPQEFFPVSPLLILDNISWSYGLILVTLALSVILTDVARASEADWLSWAGSLSITALGLFTVLAGNPLTLLMGWTAIDLFEIVILLAQIVETPVRERVVVAFSARVAGIVFVIWAGIAARSLGSGLTFETIPPQVSIYLLLAAGFRLGVLPLHLPFLREPPLRRGLGTLLRLVPAAASLVLLARTASVGVPSSQASFLLGLSGLAALYGGGAWASADNELDGRQFWILGMAAFSLSAAVLAQPQASLAWGEALLLSGGLLFLFSARHRFLLLLPVLGALGFTALPYTPAWEGVRLYASLSIPWLVVFLLAHALLMVGYLRHTLRPGQPLAGVERWVTLIYPWGLALLPLAHFVVAWWDWRLGSENNRDLPALVESWPAIAALGLGGILGALRRRGLRIPTGAISFIYTIFTFNWLYRLLWGLYHSIRRGIVFINLILEGEGGILWTLLLLTLLLSLLFQRGL